MNCGLVGRISAQHTEALSLTPAPHKTRLQVWGWHQSGVMDGCAWGRHLLTFTSFCVLLTCSLGCSSRQGCQLWLNSFSVLLLAASVKDKTRKTEPQCNGLLYLPLLCCVYFFLSIPVFLFFLLFYFLPLPPLSSLLSCCSEDSPLLLGVFLPEPAESDWLWKDPAAVFL